MTSRSTSSTPSEGEIVETDSEKATTSLRTVNDNNVNPQSRHQVSISRSPSPVASPKTHRSRTRSRSPYREPRGAKRPRDDDHYNDRPREDTRRFKVRYEDRPHGDRRRSQNPYDADLSRRPEPKLSYDDRYGRPRDNGHKTRSRSPPYSKSARLNHGRNGGKDRNVRQNGHSWQDQGRRGYEKGRSRFSRDQSVSDRGHSPVATASLKQTAETRHNQKHNIVQDESTGADSAAKYVHHSSESHRLIVGFLVLFKRLILGQPVMSNVLTTLKRMKLR